MNDKHNLFNTLIYPFTIVATMLIVHYLQYIMDWNIKVYGIFPRKWTGLPGILFTPFIHGDSNHLFNNVISFSILGTTLFYFYKKISLKVLVWIYLMSGVWTWVSARESYHIGASGVIYGLFSFIAVSGFLRKNLQLIAISFFVVFVYGSMVWGIFPIKLNVSFEGHLWGFVAGVILAVYYQKQGPQKKEYFLDEEDDEEDEFPYWEIPDQTGGEVQRIHYVFKPKSKDYKQEPD